LVHWADVVAQKLLERGPSHRIASGTSISGRIHLGNAGDVIYADGIARAVEEAGGQAQVVWIADDVDPLRAVPEQMPASFTEHLGKPVCDLPDADGCHERLTDHFIAPFLESLKALGIEPVEKRGSRMYAAGEYDEAIQTALRLANDIARILERVSGSKKPEGWLPFDPVCENCGRIATTDATSAKGDRVHYRCGGGVAGRKRMEGCGHEGSASLRHGKLTWRVEWAARWKILGVTCEPFGKEHSAAGGSYDTSKVISQQVFGYPPPEPVLYEYILVGGAKMAKSKGNVMALSELIDVLPPEAVRYFYFRGEPNKHKDFDPASKLLPLVEEFERAQAIVAGRTEPSPREEPDLLRRALHLSQLSPGRPVDYGPVAFGHLLTVAQLAATAQEATQVLRRSGDLPEGAGADAHLERRLALARAFVARYLPEGERIRILGDAAQVDSGGLPPGAGPFFACLGQRLEALPWRAEAVHNAVFECAQGASLPPRDGFRALYLAFTGRDRGPRAGHFLAALDRAFVVERLRALSPAPSDNRPGGSHHPPAKPF
jgi:lysyl-tRNA synthetase class 1